MEVLVVVTILVILAGTGGVIYMNVLESGKEDIARAQVKALEEAASIYKLNNGDFPANLALLTQPQQNGKTAILEPSALFDPWGREYAYVYPGSHSQTTQKPDIWSGGKDGNNQIGNWR
jgi:type II secretion system protein G